MKKQKPKAVCNFEKRGAFALVAVYSPLFKGASVFWLWKAPIRVDPYRFLQ
jgi:hypothetical protein